ncbi:hypothetical protein [Sphingomonas humi]|uniref:hypothetical protein n=1 Tax=Sphingomonas humi TaxID=335630 RepID=UPI0031D9C005
MPPAFGAAYVAALAPAGCIDFRRGAAGTVGREIARLDGLLAQADRKGLGPGRQALQRAWAKVQAGTGMTCRPDRIATELKAANDRLERALKDLD